jgi:uncharacterized membrane protein HdeD (DUF308 family)
MRPLVVIAIVLIVSGAFVIIQDVPYTSERRVLKIGDMEATVQERHTIPPWLGISAIVVGIALLGAARAWPPRGDREFRHHPFLGR